MNKGPKFILITALLFLTFAQIAQATESGVVKKEQFYSLDPGSRITETLAFPEKGYTRQYTIAIIRDKLELRQLSGALVSSKPLNLRDGYSGPISLIMPLMNGNDEIQGTGRKACVAKDENKFIVATFPATSDGRADSIVGAACVKGASLLKLSLIIGSADGQRFPGYPENRAKILPDASGKKVNGLRVYAGEKMVGAEITSVTSDRPQYFSYAFKKDGASMMATVYAAVVDDRSSKAKTAYVWLRLKKLTRPLQFPVELPWKDGSYKVDTGFDISVPKGTPVMAAEDGCVVYSEFGHTIWGTTRNKGIDTPGSILIKLDRPIKYHGKTYPYLWYAHLSELKYKAKDPKGGKCSSVAPHVKKGEFIGKTGLGNKDPHLHFGILTNRDQKTGQYIPGIELHDFMTS